MSTGEEDVYSRTARDITVSWGVCHFTKTLLDQVFNRNNVFWWRAGPHDGFAVALVAPETTGPDYKLSQEDERSSSSSCNLWLGQFDWHLERKPDAVGLYQPTFKTFFVVFSEEFQAIVEKKSLAVISHVASCHGVWHFFGSSQKKKSFSAREYLPFNV